MATSENIVCIGCPMGCAVTLNINDNLEVASITGHKCKDGVKYALEEYRNPVRVLTTTVLTERGHQPLLPVRTVLPIPKTKLADGARILAKVRVKPPLKIGDVVFSELLDSGVDVVATSTLQN